MISFLYQQMTFFRSSHQRCSVKKGVLWNFAKFTGKHLWQSLFFNKVAGLHLWTSAFESLDVVNTNRTFNGPQTFTQYERCPNTKFFLVRIFRHSDLTFSPSIFPYSVRMQENVEQKKLRIWTLFTQRLPVVNVKFCLIIQIQIVVSLQTHDYLLSGGIT